MIISIEGEPKEVAALVVAIQERQGKRITADELRVKDFRTVGEGSGFPTDVTVKKNAIQG